MYQKDYYKDRMDALVGLICKDIRAVMKENGVEKIVFHHHEGVLNGNIPMVTFHDKTNGAKRMELGEIISDTGTGGLILIGSDVKFSAESGCISEDRGCDLADALPGIYAAVCDIVDADDVRPNERI